MAGMTKRCKAAATLGISLLLGGCSLPTLEGRPASFALAPELAAQTTLGRGITPVLEQRGKLSGFYTLADPQDAFAARALLSHTAEKTLDVQYYIWRDDITGTLLLEELHAAAQRGVRVRLLLDDNGTSGLDSWLAALDSHPLIEVRLFNPFSLRSPKSLGFITHFSRANRRMHNKSLTADNSATIVGGRNIGDEYFGASDGVVFADLDVLAIGPVVKATSNDFDRYWASASAYPVSGFLPAAPPERLQQLQARSSQVEQEPAAAQYLQALRQLPFIQQLVDGQLPMEWASATIVSDDPAKGLGQAVDQGLLSKQLAVILGQPQQHVELVSPYFVPTAAGVKAFTELTEQGVSVRILTNALEATDVAAVHSGYAKRRKALLEAGVELFEMRRDSPTAKPRGKAGPFGSSGSSLHAKTFAVDGEQMFVGSFNFDPRSVSLNTELGFVIQSPKFAQQIQAVFDEGLLQSAYQVQLSEDGQVYWLAQRGEQVERLDKEPGTGFWQRAGVKLLSWLPIEWLL
ncbi:phospholipase D family protein [Pseudomonas spirodelae]|uniref:Phospholipase D family protein n=1 Tax=Pseudomonas spirodelae TaxID=3101751 RepID=A0ABU5PCP3_9PSED|nr:phospholipase D family protein [Pseudomonas sp. T5W1]MEA1607404.1 phospholipase D family protein [Pseudomonas sp. T5W1]